VSDIEHNGVSVLKGDLMLSTHRRGTPRVLVVAAIAAACSAESVRGQESQDSGSGPSVLEEVVVTAQKREERLQDVPLSVTALSSDQLVSLKLNSGTDIAKYTPNLRISNAGNEDQPKISIRGLSQFDFNLNASSPTGVFYDEVYIASQFLGGPQIYDMQRLEVLRGPQGTLFGKNTVGGAVDFITRAPTLEGETHAYLAGEAGSNSYYRAEGATTVHLIEGKFAARVAFNASQSDGWVENVNPDASARDLSSINNHAFRATFAYKNEDFDATLRLWTTRSSPTAIGIIAEGTCPAYCLTIPPLGLFPPTTPGTEISGVNPRINPFTGEPMDLHEGAYDRSGSISVKGNGTYLTMNKTLGDFTLTSVSSYLSGDFKNLVDGDGSIRNLFTLDFYAKTREYSQDLRLTSHFDGRFNFIGGLYYFHDEVDPSTTARFGDVLRVLQPFGAPPTTYEQTRTSIAAYVDGSFSLTSQAEIFMGIRETREKGDIDNFVAGGAAPLSVGYEETEPSGRAGMRFRVNDDLMFYGQYSRGYRSSALNGNAGCASELNVAKPEFLNSFELGMKSQWLERRLTFNTAAFYYDFSNQQFRAPASGISPCPGSANPIGTALLNAAKSRIYGIEFETLARVTRDFSVMLGVGLLDSEYKDLVLADTVNGGTADLSGNRLLEAPPYTANLALDYAIPFERLKIGLHADANWTGKQYFTAFNDITPYGGDISRAHWESNARISFGTMDGKYDFGIWGKNLNDNEARAFSVNPAAFGIRFTTIPYPRRYGADFRWNF
jgi:iron complex outermembrane recepter protein